MLLYMEFAVLHHKLLKRGLFNLSVNWPHFQKRSSLGSLEVGDARVYTWLFFSFYPPDLHSVDRVGKRKEKPCVVCMHICDV